MTPLHWASFGGNTTIVEELLDAGGDIEFLNNGLNTPLHMACSVGCAPTVQLLLDRGADIRIRNLESRDALFMAVLYCRREKLLEQVFTVLFARGVSRVDEFESSRFMFSISLCTWRSISMRCICPLFHRVSYFSFPFHD